MRTFFFAAGATVVYLATGLALGRYLYGSHRATVIDGYAENGLSDPVGHYQECDEEFDKKLSLVTVFAWPLVVFFLLLLGFIAAFSGMSNWIKAWFSRSRIVSDYEVSVAAQEISAKKTAMEDMQIHDRDGELYGGPHE